MWFQNLLGILTKPGLLCGEDAFVLPLANCLFLLLHTQRPSWQTLISSDLWLYYQLPLGQTHRLPLAAEV